MKDKVVDGIIFRDRPKLKRNKINYYDDKYAILSYLAEADEGYYWWYRSKAIVDYFKVTNHSILRHLNELTKLGLVESKIFIEENTYNHITLYSASDKGLTIFSNGKV